MKTENWDVIILGAGTAGLALARFLRSSYRVLILERRAAFHAEQRIGESLPGSAGVLLWNLGLYERFLEGPHREKGSAVSIWDQEFPVWRDALIDPAGPGWVLDRRSFDHLLREGAIESGAVIKEGHRQIEIDQPLSCEGWSVHLSEDDIAYQAPVLIDATGRSATVSRRLGLERQIEDNLLCIYSFLTCRPEDEDLTLRTCADEHGWWYTVQVPHGKRVLAYHIDANDTLWKKLRGPEDFIAHARQHPFIAEAIQGATPSKINLHPAGTTILDIANLADAGKGFLAIGDALMAFDPISSQGMFHALATAASAANAIMAGFPGNPAAMNAFQSEMLNVSKRYLTHLQDTYAGPVRFAHYPFWSKRRRVIDILEKVAE
ncbi:hypothetical protein BTA51_17735 [Hahella sp. CCB-MM4]|uniref:NAD(P)/FAD-dependent oxidoreductase n=1 Tax=Hahella sp. (strain CCB-MM4) TaxID=1926491 RepID=UPI000B9A43EA|nr:NAD(P)/FAD-dependent oxidoreductase [Hahella sp. CCB-MM4]OZG72188.1 hypothetical protein BTA51_17735 [Hahella sp. CCB-MM4]